LDLLEKKMENLSVSLKIKDKKKDG
jgi:hypothetical protein